jgi:hypothetical protein
MVALLLFACAAPVPPDAAADLTVVLGPDQARAGVVTDPAALWDGISAEGAPGDLKIYNDRVRFIVEAPGDGNYYGEQGGTILDADLVRPEGEPGRDLLDDVMVMAGVGRTVAPTRVAVIDDGADGGPAVVRVEGHGAALKLITGALENDDLVPWTDLDIRTDYVLAPGSWTLQVTTTVTNRGPDPVPLEVGDVGFVAQEVAELWAPGTGRQDSSSPTRAWTAAVAKGNELAFAILGDSGPLVTGAVVQLLGQVAPVLGGFGPRVELAPGDSTVWTRAIGVAPDLATLTDTLRPEGRVVQGTVASDDGAPVSGARVHVLVDGAVDTMAVTGDDGRWSARVPDGAVTFVASGRGAGQVLDLPAGAPWYGPYGARAAESLRGYAAPHASRAREGWGTTAAVDSPELRLVRPGVVRVEVQDGLPAMARLCFESPDTAEADLRLVPERPQGCAAVAVARDGAVDVPVEPGTYRVLVYRGVRDETFETTVRVESGGMVPVAASLVRAWDVPGVFSGDPHSHAAPSSDGKVSMEGRLLAHAANGVDVHFGTDHDHVVDYNPLREALGLPLVSIVADEVSPLLRGHFNAYPAPVRAGPNGGAPRWWWGVPDTAALFASIRDMIGPTGVLQANHPGGRGGYFGIAGYDPETGVVERPDFWGDDFDAVEVLNGDDHESFFPWWLDLQARGVAVTPVGVSDTHGLLESGVGRNLTWYLADAATTTFTPELLRTLMAEGRTAVGRGPFLAATVDGAWAAGSTVAAGRTLEVVVHAPSWMPVERLRVWKDGVAVQVLPCAGQAPTPCRASIPLEADADSLYVVTAEADTPMSAPHEGVRAWATSGAVRVVAGAGAWTPPRAALVVEQG